MNLRFLGLYDVSPGGWLCIHLGKHVCLGPAICHRALVMAECQRGVRNPLIRIDMWITAVTQIDLWL